MKRLWICGALVFGVVLSTAGAAEEEMKILVNIDAVTTSSELHPVDGLTSAGQPNEHQFELVAEAGYKAVIDLRGSDEDRGLDEAAVLQKLGLDYVELPVSSPDAISMENAARLNEILAKYEGEPVLLHCGSGNRVGALLALRESLRGADDLAALQYGRSAGLMGLEPLVRQRLAEK